MFFIIVFQSDNAPPLPNSPFEPSISPFNNEFSILTSPSANSGPISTPICVKSIVISPIFLTASAIAEPYFFSISFADSSSAPLRLSKFIV